MDVVMDVNAHESRVFNVGVTLFVGNVASCLLIPESLAMPKVHHVNEWAFGPQTDTEIAQTKVPVNIPKFMDFFESIKYLQSDKQASDWVESVVA